MGLKCQLVINMDTQKLFVFTVRDGNIISLKISVVATLSILRPAILFLSVLHHFEHFAVKLPMRIEQTG